MCWLSCHVLGRMCAHTLLLVVGLWEAICCWCLFAYALLGVPLGSHTSPQNYAPCYHGLLFDHCMVLMVQDIPAAVRSVPCTYVCMPHELITTLPAANHCIMLGASHCVGFHCGTAWQGWSTIMVAWPSFYCSVFEWLWSA